MPLTASAPACSTARPALLRAPRGSIAGQRLAVGLQRRWQRRAQSCAVRATAQQEKLQEAAPAALSSSDNEEGIPPGCARYTVKLSKPLGLILEERPEGGIVVAEIVPGGNAERSGEVSVGDQLIATSGFTYTTQQKYQDNWVKGGEQVVRLNVRGEKFDTVMAAISSHPGNMKVTLELQRCS